MDFKVPSNFIEFDLGWYRGIDFDQEADQLLNILNNAKKENDIQRYIKDNKKWFIPASLFEDYDFVHMAHPIGRICGAKRPKCEAERSVSLCLMSQSPR